MSLGASVLQLCPRFYPEQRLHQMKFLYLLKDTHLSSFLDPFCFLLNPFLNRAFLLKCETGLTLLLYLR